MKGNRITPLIPPAVNQPPAFYVGSVPVYGDVILAPMAGFSDLPFRALCREMGSAMSYSPCILDLTVLHRRVEDFSLMDFLASERPVVFQLIGAEEDELLAAAERLMERSPDIIDLNFGCPARRVVSGGRGAALLREPKRIGHIVRRLVEILPIPVTAKIRLGWDAHSKNYLEVARILEDSGAALIAVHGRTRAQQYSGKADWGAIGEVKRAVSIPVLANGDVRTPEDIEAVKSMTGCDGVMIGRGAIGNPWIFARRSIREVPYHERLAMIRRHALWMVHYYGARMGIILFRKHVVRYIQELHAAARLRPRLLGCEVAGDLFAALEQWLPEESN